MAVKRSVVITIGIAFGAVLAAGLLLTTCLNRDEGPLPSPGISEELLPAGIEKFQKLDDMLYRGAQPDGRGFRDLEQKLGIRTVINLRKRHSDEKMLKGTSLAYKNIGMNVWDAEDEDVIEFLKLVKDEAKGPFFVHCEHGVDRTGFMCAIYRIVIQGWDKEKALAERRSFRPHRIWRNLERYIRKMDVEAIRKKAGL
jgi:protein tyrosine/serine phosphatase